MYEYEIEETKTNESIIASALIQILENQIEIKKHFGLVKDDSYYGDCCRDHSIIEDLETIE